MSKLKVNSDPRVKAAFAAYPPAVRKKMKSLRKLVLESAKEIDGLENLEETLKWGEPSYLAKKGSTLRMDWKAKTPDQYQMYFKCTSRLVETFKGVFGDQFNYQGNRAITFQLDEKVPEKELKECIKATLTYHKVKEHPTLGI